MPAHPRSRGEHEPGCHVGVDECGSSPLARGTPNPTLFTPLSFRLIPARAGNTMAVMIATGSISAHPRSRGEHKLTRKGDPAHVGSSPLARGTLVKLTAAHCPKRLIPARAGNTRCREASTCGLTAHPRSRGEHLENSTGKILVAGSSPLARGTPNILVWRVLRRRLIPARAGNTE